MRILLVEDDPTTSKSIEMMLTHANLNVYATDLGEEGIDLAKLYDYDLILLDLHLPDMSGHEVLRQLRMARVETPILILTGESGTESKLRGFGFGADDYMTKPFSPKELVLRVKSVLKRSANPTSGAELECGPFRFVKNSLHFYTDGELVDLTSTEFKLMLYLCERKNVPQDRHDILVEVMGYSGEVYSRTLDTHMKRLRRKLGKRADMLETVRGIGYQVVIPSS